VANGAELPDNILKILEANEAAFDNSEEYNLHRKRNTEDARLVMQKYSLLSKNLLKFRQ
jgi:hypothetical protein